MAENSKVQLYACLPYWLKIEYSLFEIRTVVLAAKEHVAGTFSTRNGQQITYGRVIAPGCKRCLDKMTRSENARCSFATPALHLFQLVLLDPRCLVRTRAGALGFDVPPFS